MQAFDLKNENYHTGYLIRDTLRSRPDAICQIDAATGESETNASVLARSIQLAKCFRKLGAKVGDVLAIGGRNHLDLHIPYYAGIMNGYPVAGVDPQFKFNEIKNHFERSSPKIAFCQKEWLADYERAVEELGLDTKVICFGDGEKSMKSFIQQYDGCDDEEFEPASFDLDKIVWLVSTGGTTGVVKLAIITHRAYLKKQYEMLYLFRGRVNENSENIPALNLSPIQWVTGFFNALSQPVMHQIKIQTSAPQTTEHVIDIINKYKPLSMFMSPSLAASILKGDKECELSCLRSIVVSGGKVSKQILQELRTRVPNSMVKEIYGQTENIGPVFRPSSSAPLGSFGKETISDGVQIKLVDPETGKEITAPYEHGELWNSNAAFSGYYKDPKETAAAFSEDGWFKTGDIMYRDEQGYYYFVERLKMLIKYRSYHVIPPELEAVISSHPGVSEVSVTSVEHAEDGEHPVACVVRAPGAAVSARDIKDLVASQLSDSKRLRGGVVFLDEIPYTSSGKVARGKLRQIVKNAHRE